MSNQGFHLPFDRSHHAGELSIALAGKRVHLMGWVARARDLGGVRFVDLRDRHGHVQVVIDASDAAMDGATASLRMEDVIAVEGTVRARPAEMVRTDSPA
ncbi:MAG TPA: OB-fold nucleic acid binding domain-containing protein, partial [Candidatus Krumholzibacteria bacterium]